VQRKRARDRSLESTGLTNLCTPGSAEKAAYKLIRAMMVFFMLVETTPYSVNLCLFCEPMPV